MNDQTVTLPELELPATGSQRFSLAAFRGHPFVLYFYPKDDTPGCTLEGADFRDLYDGFRAAKLDVFGVSRDSVASHERFKAKMGFPFELLSDAEEKACDVFGVIKMKNMYGKQVRGIERSTFIIDAKGVLRHAMRGIKVPSHVDEVLQHVRAL